MFSLCLLTFCIVHRINGISSDRRRFDFRPEDIDILHYCVVKRVATDAQTRTHTHTHTHTNTHTLTLTYYT